MRASNAQSVSAMTRIIVTNPRVCRNAVTSMSSGIVGMTKNTFVTRLRDVVDDSAQYAANNTEHRREHGGDRARGRLRAEAIAAHPQMTCAKTSVPWSVVPKRWCNDGCWRASRSENSVALLAGSSSGAIRPSTTMPSTTPSPTRAFGLLSITSSQPGTSFFRARTTGIAAGSSMIGVNLRHG